MMFVRSKLRTCAGCLALALAVGLPFVAHAEEAPSDADLAGARALAQQGLDAYQGGDYEKAVDFLKRAEGVFHAPTQALMMARGLIQLGKLIEAREVLIRISREALPNSAPPAFTHAQESAKAELASLEPRIPYLTVHVEGAKEGASEATVNGVVLREAFWGAARPTDPGQLVLMLNGDESTRVVVDLKEGAREEATLKAAAPGSMTKASAEFAPQDEGGEPSRLPMYASFGVGAAGVAVGTVFLVSFLKHNGDGNKLYDDCAKTLTCGSSEEKTMLDSDEKAAHAGTLSLIGYGVGAAGIAAGLTFFLLQKKSTNSSSAAGSSGYDTRASRTVSPYASFNQIGVTGTF